MKPVDAYFYNTREPFQSIMLHVRHVAFNILPDLEERLSYKVPFYYLNNRPLFYLNILKGKNYLDIAFMHGVLLERDFDVLKNNNNRKKVRAIQVENFESFDVNSFAQILVKASKLCV